MRLFTTNDCQVVAALQVVPKGFMPYMLRSCQMYLITCWVSAEFLFNIGGVPELNAGYILWYAMFMVRRSAPALPCHIRAC